MNIDNTDNTDNTNNCWYCSYLAQVKTTFETAPQYICTNPNIDSLKAKENGYNGCESFKNTKSQYDFNKFVHPTEYFKLLTMKIECLNKPIDVVIRFNEEFMEVGLNSINENEDN